MENQWISEVQLRYYNIKAKKFWLQGQCTLYNLRTNKENWLDQSQKIQSNIYITQPGCQANFHQIVTYKNQR